VWRGPRTLGGQNVEFFSVKVDGTKSNHLALKGYRTTVHDSVQCDVRDLIVLVQEVSVCIGTVSCWDEDIIVRKIREYLENTHSPFVEKIPAVTKLWNGRKL